MTELLTLNYKYLFTSLLISFAFISPSRVVYAESYKERVLQPKTPLRVGIAPISQSTITIVEQIQPPTVVQSVSTDINCSNQVSAKAFIYCHESGNRPEARNAGGCRGLGQACPGSKLTCGDYDYVCQDAWFTNYMLQSYGTWEKAKAHWLARVPINGIDVGNWW